MKEAVDRLRFFIDRIKYKRSRHFYLTVIIIFVLISAALIPVYINLQLEIRKKENILKSYYSDINSEDTASDKASGETESENVFTLQPSDDNQKETVIKAYICGEVKNPGVYEMEEGARVVDLLEIAGGESENACLEIINLARIIIDGQKIYIPSEEEIASGSSLFLRDSSLIDFGSPENLNVNINSANLKELESLPGIGPVIARNIIEYRTGNGPFKRKEELKKVTGIGEKKYEQIKNFISI